MYKLTVKDQDKLTQEAVISLRDAKEMTKTAKIKTMFDGGMGPKEISNVMGIRYNHAYNVIQNYVLTTGIAIEKRGREGSASNKEIEEKLKAGMKIIDVAKELQCNYNKVWQVKNLLDAETKLEEEKVVVNTKKGSKNQAV